MNRDFAEMLSTLLAAGVEFLVVGAHAMAVHGRPRATGDLDIWVRCSPDNAARVWKALEAFGAPQRDLTLTDLATPGVVFQIGVAPCRIDLLTSISGVDFEGAWSRRLTAEVDGLAIPFLGKADLLANKRAARRPKDLGDIALLEEDGDKGGR